MKEWWSRSDGPLQLSGFDFNEWVALAVIFLIVTLFALVLLLLLRPTDDDPDSLEPARRWFGPFTGLLAGMVPADATTYKEIQQELYLAGYSQPQMPENFLAMRSLLTVGPVLVGLLIALFGPPAVMWPAVIGGFVLGVLGFAVPRVMLQSEGNARAERLRQGLPVLMDTLSLCLSTGNSLPDSFRRSGESIRRGYPDLAHEVRIVNKQAELRSLEHALLQWKDRIPLPELSSLVFLLAQGDRLGTDVTKGLLELASSYRTTARQNADTAANRMSFYMLFPTVLCLLVSGAILIAGPSVLAAVKQGIKTRDMLRESQDKAKELREKDRQEMEKKAKGKLPLPKRGPNAVDPNPEKQTPARPEL